MKNKRELVEKITIKEDDPKERPEKSPSVITKKETTKNIFEKTDDFEEIEGEEEEHLKEIEEKGNDEENKEEIESSSIENPKNLEEEIIHDLKNNLFEISASVSTIKSEYSALRESESQILLNIKTPKLKSKKLSKLDHPEIVSFLTKKQEEQEQRERRRLNEIAEIEKKRRIEEENKLKEKEDQKIGKINEIKKMWFVKEKNIEKKQEEEAKQKHVDEIYQKYRNMIPLFEIKEKRDKEDEIQRAELVKEYLKKHKEIYMSANQPYQEKELTEHQKRYQEKSEQLEKQINEEKIEIFQKIEQDNESLKNLYRGKVTERVISEIKIQEEKKEIPFRIRERMKGYEEIVKQNHLPKSKLRKMRSNSSSLDMKTKRDSDSNLSFREIKRYKYLHGVSYGSVVERRPMAKSFDEERRVGKGYLEFMKSLPKKKTEKCSSVTTPLKLFPKPNPLLHNRPKNSYVDINDEPTREEIQMVLQQLKTNDKKIQNREKMVSMKNNTDEKNQNRREINNEILLSVEKKLDLLHKLESNKLEGK